MKKQIFILSILILVSIKLFGQIEEVEAAMIDTSNVWPIYPNAKINTYEYKPSKTYFESSEEILFKIPIIELNDTSISNIINEKIKNNFKHYSDKNERNFDSILEQASEKGLVALDFKIGFNKKGLLSIILYCEGCGSYCTEYKIAYLFDLSNGNELTIQELFDKDSFSIFQSMVYERKRKSILSEIISLNQEPEDPDYKERIDMALKCLQSNNFCNFYLDTNSLTIFDPCDYPRVVRAWEPFYDLTFSIDEIYNYINWRIN